MKKSLAVLISVFIYFIIWWFIAFLSFALNLAILGKETGVILGIGGLFAFWGSFKFVKWFWDNYLFKKEFNRSNLIKKHSQEELNPPPLSTDNFESSKFPNLKGINKNYVGKFIFLGLAIVLLVSALIFIFQHNPSTPDAVNELEIINQDSINFGKSKHAEESYSTLNEKPWINSKHGISIRVPDGYILKAQNDEGIIFDIFSPTEKGRIFIEVEDKSGTIEEYFKDFNIFSLDGEIPNNYDKYFVISPVYLDSSSTKENLNPFIEYTYSGIKENSSVVYHAKVFQFLKNNKLYTITCMSSKEDFDNLLGRFIAFNSTYYIKIED